MIIRGASGFGDAIYLYPIVRYYSHLFNPLTVLTDYPAIYDDLHVVTRPFCACVPVLDCSYVNRKHLKETNQFQDMLINAEIKETIDFTIPHKQNIKTLFSDSKKKKTCLIVDLYNPMGTKSAAELKPDKEKFDATIKQLERKYNLIFLTNDDERNAKNRLCFYGKIAFSYLCDLFQNSDLIFCQVGWPLVLAEALDKKCLLLFSHQGTRSKNNFINSITPEKVITKKSTTYFYDDEKRGIAL
jgi:hypothetical protein